MDKNKDIISLKTIPPNSEMTITLNTDMYIRLQQCLLEALPYKDEAHFKEILAQISRKEASEGLAYHAHTLIFIIQTLEEAARTSNLLKTRKFDLLSQKVVD